MTKEEIIELIKNREDELWKDLKESIEETGMLSNESISIQSQWYAISLLINELGIE